MEAESSGFELAGRPGQAVLTWLRLVHVFQKIDQQSADHLRSWGLSVAQFDMLATVGKSEGLTQQKLAEALLVTKGNVCQLVDRMERDGLLRRCQVGRSNQLFLTDDGRRLFHDVVPAQEKLIEELFSSMSDEDQAQLAVLLRKFDQSLRRHDIVKQWQLKPHNRQLPGQLIRRIRPSNSR